MCTLRLSCVLASSAARPSAMSSFQCVSSPRGERLRVGAGVKFVQVMSEAAILQPGLVGGDAHPIIARLEQRAAFGTERFPFLRIWNLCEVWFEVFGAAVRCADVHDAAVDAASRQRLLRQAFLPVVNCASRRPRIMYSARPANSG